MRKIFKQIFLLLLCTAWYSTLFAVTTIPATDPNIQYFGRFSGLGTTSPKAGWAGSHILVKFQGTSIKIKLNEGSYGSGNRYWAIIDGNDTNPLQIQPTTGKATYTLATGLTDGEHTCLFFKLTGAWSRTTNFEGFELDDNKTLLTPPDKPSRRIEFYGNSVTEGTYNAESPETGESNNYHAWGAKTARKLNAEYRQISKSGLGLLDDNYAGGHILNELYWRYNQYNYTDRWNFSSWTPHVVVMEIGQNDSWLKKHTPDQYKAEYVSMINNLRTEYPNATIIVTLGSMSASDSDQPWFGYIQYAVGVVNDPKVFAFNFTYLGRDGHPYTSDNENMANEFVAFLNTLPNPWNETTVLPTGISINPTTGTVNTGATFNLIATVTPSNATNKTVTWTSSNTSVATVSSAGVVTGVTAGTAVITAKTHNNLTATATINVNSVIVPVTSVTVAPTTATINVGATIDLNETVLPSNATNKSVTWTSSATAIATVNATGLVTGIAAGSATITVTTSDQNKTATSTITVNPPATGLVYSIYSETGINEFAADGGTVTNYATTIQTYNTGAPEGTEYKNMSVTGHYAAYNFNFPTGLNKSGWAPGFLEFQIKTLSDFEVGLVDAAGVIKRLPISSYITKSGNWENAKIPISAFTGVNLSSLKKIYFYRKWNSAINMSFDNVRVTAVSSLRSNPIVESVSEETLLCYPNPIKKGQNTYLELPSEVHGNIISVSIFDVTGKVMVSQNIINKNSFIELQTNNFNSGVYIVKLKSNKQVYNLTIIIK